MNKSQEVALKMKQLCMISLAESLKHDIGHYLSESDMEFIFDEYMKERQNEDVEAGADKMVQAVLKKSKDPDKIDKEGLKKKFITAMKKKGKG